MLHMCSKHTAQISHKLNIRMVDCLCPYFKSLSVLSASYRAEESTSCPFACNDPLTGLMSVSCLSVCRATNWVDKCLMLSELQVLTHHGGCLLLRKQGSPDVVVSGSHPRHALGVLARG